MAKLSSQRESGYGYPQPSFVPASSPIPSPRNPAASDTGYKVGQLWANTTVGTLWAMTQNASGSATWLSLGGSLTPSVASITTGVAATLSLLAGSVWSATGSNAAISLTLTPKGAGNVIATSGDLQATNGNLTLNTAGNGIKIKEGANARMGTATLVAGANIVGNTSVTANTVIFLSAATTGGAPGTLSVVLNAGVGFTINSTSGTDISTVNWLLIEAL